MLVLISQAIMAICLSLLGLEHKQGKRTADEDLFNLQTKDKTQIKKKKKANFMNFVLHKPLASVNSHELEADFYKV